MERLRDSLTARHEDATHAVYGRNTFDTDKCNMLIDKFDRDIRLAQAYLNQECSEEELYKRFVDNGVKDFLYDIRKSVFVIQDCSNF